MSPPSKPSSSLPTLILTNFPSLTASPRGEFCDMRIVTWPLPTLQLPPAQALKPPSALGIAFHSRIQGTPATDLCHQAHCVGINVPQFLLLCFLLWVQL